MILSFHILGIFGKTSAVFGVCETSGRMAMHAHLANFGELPSHFMQVAATSEDMRARVTAIIDSRFKASVPSTTHLSGLIRRAAQQQPVRYGFIPHSRLLYDVNRSFSIMETCGCHGHSFTCHKGTVGNTMCRLSRGQTLRLYTGCEHVYLDTAGNLSSRLPERENLLDVDYSEYPFRNVDGRVMMWELARPEIDSSTEDLLSQLPIHEQELYNSLNEAKKAYVTGKMRKRNAYIIETSDVLASAVSGNTNAVPLGGLPQSKAILFYLLKYMSKDSVKLSACVSLLHTARQHLQLYPSTAENADTVQRQDIHLLQRMVKFLFYI